MSTLISSKITTSHLERKAIVYLRQSTPKQVREHLDSQLCQRTLGAGNKIHYRSL